MLHFGKIPKKLVKFGENSVKFWQICENLGKKFQKTAKHSAIFNEIFEIRERFSSFFEIRFQSGAKECIV